MPAPASVWIDAQATQGKGSSERGLGRHVVEIVKAIHALSPQSLGSVRFDPSLEVPEALAWLGAEGLIGRGLRPPPSGEAPAIYHVPSPFERVGIEAIWPDWIRHGREPVRTVVTLHDLVPLVLDDLYFRDDPYFKTIYESRLGLIRQADQVLTISEQTAADAVERLGVDEARITPISSGVSDAFSSLITSSEEAEEVMAAAYPRIRDGFLLYVGGGDPRKNMRGTIEAFSQLPEELRRAHQLVIVCRLGPDETAALRLFARRLGIHGDDVFFAGFAEDRELAALYRRCLLFVFPSLYEGFGLPVLEAMSCGAPVAASNNSSLPEVLGDLEATFDPFDPADIATTLREVLEHPERLDGLRERSRRRTADFTWEKTAAKVLDGYERAMAGPGTNGRRAKRRPRVAVVTPWPPQDSPAALGSRQLVRVLAEQADVDVLVTRGDPASEPDQPDGVSFFSADQIDWLLELRESDALVYALDGSPDCEPALAMLGRHPGAVVAYDDELAQQDQLADRATAVLSPPAGNGNAGRYASLLGI